VTGPDYRDHYAGLTGPLLTRIRDAALQHAPTYGDPPIRVQTIGQTPEGSVVPDSFVLIERVAPNDALWTVVIGFDNSQDFANHIDMEVPEPQFPPLEVPIKVGWYGTNRRGARESVSVEFPAIELLKDKARWADKVWTADSRELAEAVVRAVLDHVLVLPTPYAAEADLGRGRFVPAPGQVRATQLGEDGQVTHVVALVHGIRTTAAWAEMVRSVLEEIPGVAVVPIGYGYLDVFRFLVPGLTRRGPVERVRRELTALRQRYASADRLSVVAHSFGTYIVSRILAEESEPRLFRLALCGSIVKQSFRWDLAVDRIAETPVLNDCGSKDIYPLLAAVGTVGFGPSGTFGFRSGVVRDRFHYAGHSDFFRPEFVQEFWKPFIDRGEVCPSAWEASRPTPPWWQHLFALSVPWIPLLLVAAVVGFLLLRRHSRELANRVPPTPSLPVVIYPRPASSVVTSYRILKPQLLPGDTVRIAIDAVSSLVSAYALFGESRTDTVKVPAKYDRRKGGIYITYPVPRTAAAGRHYAIVFVQELKGTRERHDSIPYEVLRSPFRQPLMIAAPRDLGFVPVPAGVLRMGSENGQNDERPVSEVLVRALFVMDHELTFDELYGVFGGDSTKLGRAFESTLPDTNVVILTEPDAWHRLPVSLSFREAQRIAILVGGLLKKRARLPTEAEWEYAARGGLVGKQYPWGDSTDVVGGETVVDILERTARPCDFNSMPVRPVKSGGPPNGYSLYEVAGNLWEWTSTQYRAYPYKANDGREVEAAGDSTAIVIRGGGASVEACNVRVAFRGYDLPISRPGYGVRLVFDGSR